MNWASSNAQSYKQLSPYVSKCCSYIQLAYTELAKVPSMERPMDDACTSPLQDQWSMLGIPSPWRPSVSQPAVSVSPPACDHERCPLVYGTNMCSTLENKAFWPIHMAQIKGIWEGSHGQLSTCQPHSTLWLTCPLIAAIPTQCKCYFLEQVWTST